MGERVYITWVVLRGVVTPDYVPWRICIDERVYISRSGKGGQLIDVMASKYR